MNIWNLYIQLQIKTFNFLAFFKIVFIINSYAILVNKDTRFWNLYLRSIAVSPTI